MLAAWLAVPCSAQAAAPGAALRVCADPDNLPFSSADGAGFENRIAELVARELKVQLQYAWLPQRRGFVRKTIGSRLCDVFIGVPAGLKRVLTTRAYYRSGYVFVNPGSASHPLVSFDDPRLPALAIGVQLIGDDLAATPPSHALAERGATEHVVGYPVYGDGPAAARAVADLAAGRLDAALLWGPQAGYFAAHSAVPLQLTPAHAPPGAAEPFEFAMAMGVRKGDVALRDALDAVIARRGAEIDVILDAYRVPRLPLTVKATAPNEAGAASAAGAQP
jgi:mxaJ protein